MDTTGKHRQIAKIVALTAAGAIAAPPQMESLREPAHRVPSRRILTLPASGKGKATRMPKNAPHRRAGGGQRNPGRGRGR